MFIFPFHIPNGACVGISTLLFIMGRPTDNYNKLFGEISKGNLNHLLTVFHIYMYMQ